MRRIVGFSAGCLGFIALVLLIVWTVGGFAGGELGFHGWVALTLIHVGRGSLMLRRVSHLQQFSNRF